MMSELTIVSLGPGNPDLLNISTIKALQSGYNLFLRTGNHPVASWLTENGITYETFDSLYEKTDDFDELNHCIVSSLFEKASVSPVLYAVPDAATDHTVRALFSFKPNHVRINVIPGVSTYDVCTSVSVPFISESSLYVTPASDILSGFFHDPNRTLLITEIDNPILAGEIKILLSETLDDEYIIYLLRSMDVPISIPLYELDRRKDIDHRTCVLVPGSGFRSRTRFVLNDLIGIMEALRAPDGCPWDRAQTHESLRPYVIEEAWECVAAIDENDPDHLCEELGDLLFQIVFHSSIAGSFDEFTLIDVLSSICSKMLRRHPHVFSDEKFEDTDSLRDAWEKIKAAETGRQTVVSSLDDVPASLPSLKYAAKILKKLMRDESGSRDTRDILTDLCQLAEKIINNKEQIAEDSVGDLLLLCAAFCFHMSIDSEMILHRAVDRLRSRIVSSEAIMKKHGKSLEHLTFDELRVYLNHVEGEIK